VSKKLFNCSRCEKRLVTRRRLFVRCEIIGSQDNKKWKVILVFRCPKCKVNNSIVSDRMLASSYRKEIIEAYKEFDRKREIK
jgi:cytochrome c-type biogenesis protein CcmH/NrfF